MSYWVGNIFIFNSILCEYAANVFIWTLIEIRQHFFTEIFKKPYFIWTSAVPIQLCITSIKVFFHKQDFNILAEEQRQKLVDHHG